MTELQNLQKYFNDRRLSIFKIRAIETEAGLPDKTLDHFIKGRRSLTEDAVSKLVTVLKDFGYKPLQ